MFALPLTGTAAREMMGDIAHVVEVLAPENRSRMLTLRDALVKGRRFMAENTDRAVRRVTYICAHGATGHVLLISIGTKGGWKKEWDFGPL